MGNGGWEMEEGRRAETERERERDGNVWLTHGTANHCESCNAFLIPVLKVTLNLRPATGVDPGIL